MIKKYQLHSKKDRNDTEKYLLEQVLRDIGFDPAPRLSCMDI